jgi:N-methylhydantoinase A/oxoprolinase/acetone carboxylase beta subunit
MRVGTDTGGTFTDLVTDDGAVVKVLSTPDDPSRAVGAALDASARGRPELLAHGTTVATNALLERRGADVVLVTNRGLGDVIEIGRQARPSLYDPFDDRPVPLVPRDRRVEIGGRLGPDGVEVEALVFADLDVIADDSDAVAVCLLHSDLSAAHERAVGEALAARGLDVTLSTDVSPEFREYERTVTTVINAYLRPVCRRYLGRLDLFADRVVVLTSAGGLVPTGPAADRPASLLLSGPAGGVQAAGAVAAACGHPDVLTFDMGGTSTDVCLVLDGRPAPASQRTVGGFPVRLPSLDVHTIGAGGGSTAHLDAGGALVVGPESAGAVPGPACYGRGGTEPTVTDANLVAGRISAEASFPELGRLDVDAARAALERAGVTAEGVLAVVDANMEQALRAVSVERGVDPRALALVAFGGAGPLHACALAEALDMATVIVPPRAGVLSAVGLLCSPEQRDVIRSWPMPGSQEGLAEALGSLAAEAVALLGVAEGAPPVEVETSLDCRYAGQSHELRVASVEDFPDEHRRRNGYARPDAVVEVVALHATARRGSAVSIEDLPAVSRMSASGPAVLAEADCTVWVAEGWVAQPDPTGALVLTRSARA